MADSLKTFFDRRVVESIARQFSSATPTFRAKPFVDEALEGLDGLELLARGWQIAEALRRHLPDDFAVASTILLRSLGEPIVTTETWGMEVFRYLPHVFYVSKYGIEHFEAAMEAQYALTQRFSAEYSIRAFIERYPERTLARLEEWTQDASPHVRRLVSEGTRPRLPWAPRLRAFQQDPAPVLRLLELLKDDPELYVRRSVANNLNDIAKDHADIAVEVCRRWWQGASTERRWVVEHALRSLVKAGHPGALKLLGIGSKPKVDVASARFSTKHVKVGDVVTATFVVTSTARVRQTLQVDFAVHFVKANGMTSPKVFKLKRVELAAMERLELNLRVSFAPMTTRKTYPGEHRFEALVNGERFPLGAVRLK
jgi:3-methyladenine DNA glycosylase AlkC